MSRRFSRIRRLSQLGTKIATWFGGEEVGCDDDGHRYYRKRRPPEGRREKRWVLYPDEPEASNLPPEWHIWIHHLADFPLPESDKLRKPCLRPYQPDRTGTAAGGLPLCPTPREGRGRPAAKTTTAWTPEQ
jgi:NADH:ubiquinone oxidoreductase subunit